MKKLLFIVLAALSLTACNSMNVNSTLEKQDNSYNGYQIVNNSGSHIDQQITTRFEQSLNKQLQRYGYQNGSDLKIAYRIEAYDPGSRAARYWIGFGAGAAEATIRTTLSDVKGKKLGEVDSDATLKWGFFGGNSLNTIDNSAAHIAKRIYQARLLKSNK